MEKYSQFRDKGTAIAPFLPVPPPPVGLAWTPIYAFLFLCRIPFVVGLSVFYFGIVEWLPVGGTIKYALLWALLGLTGVWWVDFQVDGVKRGRLSEAKEHTPQAGTIIASSFTSPLDPLYLAGIFQPIFTRSYPNSRKVERITLLRAILLAFAPPTIVPQDESKLVTLASLVDANPRSIICVFPECTTTNGRGILPLSPSLLSAKGDTKIYPVNLRYTPQDVTTPVSGGPISWLYHLLSKPSHQMRVRIAMRVYNSPSIDSPAKKSGKAVVSGYDSNIFDTPDFRNGASSRLERETGMDITTGETEGEVSAQEQQVLDRVAEDLARLGRVKRVGLDVGDKIEFLKVWLKRRR
ncbi:Lysophosphatidic acid:oleoyl-CoA acyltransferase 1 [Didymella glomerata]|uniref:Lysophosphatidic acid:oleoyl-CoA acyltransferase 1 n=1 Tax=Didymella glomerata TaxID=749621 RepID=A0A9W8X0N1_9PLEO|nr:Lysophosphatidic acid:oleoyl-CoA acyltransferase 1 [Didymella glomerata]